MHRSLRYRLPLDALESTREGMDVLMCPDLLPHGPSTLPAAIFVEKQSCSPQEGEGHLAPFGTSFYS